MIITRYLIREVFNALIAVTIVLLLAFLCQQMVRYLNYAAIGKIPVGVLFELVSFEVPYLLAILLPLGLYFGILLAYGRLYSDNEMVIMRMSGLTGRRLARITILIALSVAGVVLALMFWANPWISAKRQEVMSGHGATLKMIQTLIPGRFQVSPDGYYVMYVGKLSRDRQKAKNVFLAQEKTRSDVTSDQEWMLVSASQGYQDEDKQTGDSFFVLKDGYRYEGAPGKNDYKIIQFKKYAIRVPEKDTSIIHQEDEALPVSVLWQDYANPKRAAELQWRVSIALSALILALIGSVMSGVRPRKSRYLMLLPASLLYILYVNLLFVARHWVEQGSISILFGMWWVHGIFLALLLVVLALRPRVW